MTPKELEYLKIGGAVAAGGLLVYLLFGNKKDNSGGTTNTDTGNYIPANTFNANFVAESLYEAMNQFGTDEGAILELLKTVTPAQFVQVIAAFGGKKYNTWTGNDYGFMLDALPLKTWLKYELSIKDYAVLRSKYPNSL